MKYRSEKTILEEFKKIGMDIKKFQNPEPYPKVKVSKEDIKWLPLIFNDYASRVSEFTAISQYNFSHFTIEHIKDGDLIKEISQAFLGISIIEMFHLDFLADVIIKLGGIPKFMSPKDGVWNSNFVPYPKTIKENLEQAIKAEEEAIVQYRRHMEIIDNISIKRLIGRIIEDELLHLKVFNDLLGKI